MSPLACGGSGDQRFAAESNDEYSEPLTNAVIGTPTGTVVVDPSGSAQAQAGGTGGSAPTSLPDGSGTGGGSTGGGATDAGASFDGGRGGEGNKGTFGQWHFDDCSPRSNFLVDSSGFGANAQQALKAACVPGISGQGVQIRSAKDVIQVPDEPQFTLDQNVAVAAWVHPNTTGGNQPIVIKRLNNQTAFSLGVHNGNIEMSVVLANGKTIISRAPIAAGTWSHVAGMYDGTFVFLFINGQQFGQVFGGGGLRNVLAPIRIGATTQSQYFDGIIDEVFLTNQSVPKETLTALACVPRPPTFTVTPSAAGPVPFDTPVNYQVVVSDNDVGFCAPSFIGTSLGFPDAGISEVFDPSFMDGVGPGDQVTFTATISGSQDADPGVHQIPFSIARSSPNDFEQIFGQLTFELATPTGCFVRTRRELMLTNVSIVDDPVRAGGIPVGSVDGGTDDFDAGPLVAQATTAGAWTFGHLMRELAPTPEAAPAMTLQLFQHWLTDQNVNGFTVAARPAIQQLLLDNWPKTPSGELDLDRSPFSLQAIVNRLDLRNLEAGSAGEGRFVFAVVIQGFPQSFTVILEYNLPAKTQDDVLGWANRWHDLSSHPFPSEEYNAALESLTRSFTDRGTGSGVNGSNLIELRTNEIALSFIQWELRGFLLSPTTGFFDETTVKETPDLSFNGTQTFADFVNQNEQTIINLVPGAIGNTVPLQFEGQNFLAGSVFNNQVEWSAPGINNPEARFHASINTCNGCHGPETNTFSFTMINPRFPGTEATLSPFMTGTTVTDPVTLLPRVLNDLGRRNADLASLVCPTDGGSSQPDGGSEASVDPVEAGPPPPTDGGGSASDGGTPKKKK